MTHAHTPSPWTVEEIDGKAWSIRCDADDTDSGTFVCDMVSSRSPHETSANARLIARAPDMADEIARLRSVNAELVAALHRLYDAFSADSQISPDMPIRISVETNGGALEQARAALAKATQEQGK